MNYNKSILSAGLVLVLSACSLTQPKAPLYNGIESSKPSRSTYKKSVDTKPVQQYKTIVETVEKEEKVTHVVKSGDYVYAIARKYSVSPYKIIKNNNLKRPYTLVKGTKLHIKTIKKMQKVTKRVKVDNSVDNANIANNSYSFTRSGKRYAKIQRQSSSVPSLARQNLNKKSSDKNIDFGYHRVLKGENLFRIGKKYHVSVFDLMAYNDFTKPQDLMAGSEIKIPVSKAVVVKTDVEEEIQRTAKKEQTNKTSSLGSGKIHIPVINEQQAKKSGFVYPVQGKQISKFGKQGHGVRNDGIDIAVKIGTPVVASQRGRVMYAQEMGHLGNMILIKHASGYISAYTHNSKLIARKGDKVSKGQLIALSGDTGTTTQPMLHFEIRRYGKALNPRRILR